MPSPPAWLPGVLATWWQPPPPYVTNKTPPFIPGMSVDQPAFILWALEERHFQQQQQVGPRLIQSQAAAVVNNPPTGAPNFVTLTSILTAWQPPPPWAYFGAEQPLTPRVLSPPIGARTDNPPVTSRATLGIILDSWKIVPPVLILRAGPLTTGVTVNMPPLVRASIGIINSIIDFWKVVPPTLVLRAPPFTPGSKTDNPPRSSHVTLDSIIAQWQPPASFPLTNTTPPSFHGQSVDQPPGLTQFISATNWGTGYTIILPSPDASIYPFIPPTPPLFPSLIGKILPIDEARATVVYVQADLGYGIIYVPVPVALIIRPPTVFPGPQMLLGFNADGTFTLYRPLQYQHNQSGDLTYQPIYGNDILNQLPVAPTGTTQLLDNSGTL